jgi:hypothetical protein
MENNPYIVTKQENVKIYGYANTTDHIVIFEYEHPEGITFYYVGVDSDRKWRRFLTESAAIEDCKWLNKRHNRILELSGGMLNV